MGFLDEAKDLLAQNAAKVAQEEARKAANPDDKGDQQN
jgi:hypothetical protein